MHSKTRKEMGSTYRKKWRTTDYWTLHREATKKREEIKGMTKQKMARQHHEDGGNHLELESIRQKTTEGIDGRQYLAVDAQSLMQCSACKYVCLCVCVCVCVYVCLCVCVCVCMNPERFINRQLCRLTRTGKYVLYCIRQVSQERERFADRQTETGKYVLLDCLVGKERHTKPTETLTDREMCFVLYIASQRCGISLALTNGVLKSCQANETYNILTHITYDNLTNKWYSFQPPTM